MNRGYEAFCRVDPWFDYEQAMLDGIRPHAGLEGRGHRAVRRLEREHDALRRLVGIPGVPKIYDLFSLPPTSQGRLR